MSAKLLRLVAPASMLALTGALLVIISSISVAQLSKETRWCNAYAPLMFPTQPEQGMDTIKIKYGKSIDGEELNLPRALRWWASYVIDPSEARSKEVMRFVRVSDLDMQALRALIGAASTDGNVKPYVALAASPEALVSAGFNLPGNVGKKGGLLTAPIWWNDQMESILEGAVKAIQTDPAATRVSIGKLAAYTVGSGVNYDLEPTRCNPPHEPPQMWGMIDVPDESLNQIYIGVSGGQSLESVGKDAVIKVLMGQDAWPTKDD